jgi:hypothetical protein
MYCLPPLQHDIQPWSRASRVERTSIPLCTLLLVVPGVQDEMEGCPATRSVNVLLMALSGTLTVWLFLGVMLVRMLMIKARKAERKKERASMEESHQFQRLRFQTLESKVPDATFDSTDSTEITGYETTSLASSYEC